MYPSMKVLLCHNFYQQPTGERVHILASQAVLVQKGHHVISYTEDNRDIEFLRGNACKVIIQIGQQVR